jgi:hypothetical protein
MAMDEATANLPQNRSYSYLDMANQLLDKRATEAKAEDEAWQKTMSNQLASFSNSSSEMTPEQQGYANTVKATLSESGPKLDPSMKWSEAQTLARSRYNPSYEQDLKAKQSAINKESVKSGFYGQLPSEQLKQNAAAAVEAEKSAKVFDFAQQLMKDSEESAFKKYELERQAFKDKVDSIFSLWSAVSADIEAGRANELSVAELTGLYRGIKTLAGRAQDNADAESAMRLQQMAADIELTYANVAGTNAGTANTKANTKLTNANTSKTKAETKNVKANTKKTNAETKAIKASTKKASTTKSSSSSKSSGTSKSTTQTKAPTKTQTTTKPTVTTSTKTYVSGYDLSHPTTKKK